LVALGRVAAVVLGDVRWLGMKSDDEYYHFLHKMGGQFSEHMHLSLIDLT